LPSCAFRVVKQEITVPKAHERVQPRTLRLTQGLASFGIFE